MTIDFEQNPETLVVKLTGRLDTNTSQELDAALKEQNLEQNLVFDFAALEYLSSAGLRLLLSYHKAQDAAGFSLVIKNVNEIIKEIFAVTGFDSVLTVE